MTILEELKIPPEVDTVVIKFRKYESMVVTVAGLFDNRYKEKSGFVSSHETVQDRLNQLAKQLSQESVW